MLTAPGKRGDRLRPLAGIKLIKRGIRYFQDVRKFRKLDLESQHVALTEMKCFADLGTYCMFMGYPRSGHSLVGALLDAHPNIIMAHELNALLCIQKGFTRNQILYLLLKNSQAYAKQGRHHGGYSYPVPHQWQGRFKKLLVIGDKKGAASVLALRRKPDLLQRLHETIGLALKIIHVTRNPYDNITTLSVRRGYRLQQGIREYFALCEVIAKFRSTSPDGTLFEMKHELLVENPVGCLRALCTHIGVEPTEDYLKDCGAIVYRSPHKSRYTLPWSPALIKDVQRRAAAFPFLAEYDYEQ